ncbi:hypothetical protein F5Y12DRAFT_797001 [Xylaria sp. FL1777]|nr:hypothetical protein F5Y12DRAFT_797001 [Xylaria sp. FL1777]
MSNRPSLGTSVRSFSEPARSMIPVPVLRRHSTFRKHAALTENIRLTPDECVNVNRRIVRTVDIILPYEFLIQGPGPKTYELHAHLGVALVADIRVRPIHRPCPLGNPELQRKIREMAANPRCPEFRHTYLHGKVWFSFRILDPDIARQPLVEDEEGD